MTQSLQQFLESLCRRQYGHHNWNKKTSTHKCTRCGKTKTTGKRPYRRKY